MMTVPLAVPVHSYNLSGGNHSVIPVALGRRKQVPDGVDTSEILPDLRSQ